MLKYHLSSQLLLRSIRHLTSLTHISNSTAKSHHLIHYRSVPTLLSAGIPTSPSSLPHLLPRGTFHALPAITKWFLPHPTHPSARLLNIPYLAPYGSTILPLELTQAPATFHRAPAPLSIFLSYIATALETDRSPSPQPTSSPSGAFYLAQSPLALLPPSLLADLPSPSCLPSASTVVDSSIWLGLPPTHTFLHRDPDANLLVQMAGQKVVRLLAPGVGGQVRGRMGVGDRVGIEEEMVVGEVGREIESYMWGDSEEKMLRKENGRERQGAENEEKEEGWEAELEAGDGLFIPQGWWHSVKGVGKGISGSVNWWFR